MEQPLKLGMIGLDTSHCPAFAGLLHHPDDPYHVRGAVIAGAFPGGSERFSLSHERVAGFTQSLRDEYQVPIYASIEELADGMDGFLLESVDGRQHLEQFRLLAEYGKPVFIDKPLACCYADAREIIEIAQQKNVPIVSSSSIRFAHGLANLVGDSTTVSSCATYGPLSLLPDYPSFYWYGIHSADLLYAFMGTGCREVQVHHTEQMDVLVGAWEDGRIGTLHGGRFAGINFGCTLFTSAGVLQGIAAAEPPYYALLLQHLLPFFRTGIPPIPVAECLEVIAFLDAAEQSFLNGGKSVALPRE